LCSNMSPAPSPRVPVHRGDWTPKIPRLALDRLSPFGAPRQGAGWWPPDGEKSAGRPTATGMEDDLGHEEGPAFSGSSGGEEEEEEREQLLSQEEAEGSAGSEWEAEQAAPQLTMRRPPPPPEWRPGAAEERHTASRQALRHRHEEAQPSARPRRSHSRSQTCQSSAREDPRASGSEETWARPSPVAKGRLDDSRASSQETWRAQRSTLFPRVDSLATAASASELTELASVLGCMDQIKGRRGQREWQLGHQAPQSRGAPQQRPPSRRGSDRSEGAMVERVDLLEQLLRKSLDKRGFAPEEFGMRKPAPLPWPASGFDSSTDCGGSLWDGSRRTRSAAPRLQPHLFTARAELAEACAEFQETAAEVRRRERRVQRLERMAAQDGVSAHLPARTSAASAAGLRERRLSGPKPESPSKGINVACVVMGVPNGVASASQGGGGPPSAQSWHPVEDEYKRSERRIRREIRVERKLRRRAEEEAATAWRTTLFVLVGLGAFAAVVAALACLLAAGRH